jgi:hypothetical protein
MKITTPAGVEYEVIGAHSVNGYDRRILDADLSIKDVTPPNLGVIFDCKLDTPWDHREGVTLKVYGFSVAGDGAVTCDALIEWQEA